MAESIARRKRRALQILERLDQHLPHARIELDFETPLELLVAVMLSAQCTDKRVNLVTPALFARFPEAARYAEATQAELERYIQTCGLYRSKAKNIIAAAQALVRDHDGEVPLSRQALEALPGVGRKTAGVVANHLGGDPSFPVDTHIRRVAHRLGLTDQTHPDKVELDLKALTPRLWWAKGHQLLIWHGRRTCFARSPDCGTCVVAGLCPKRGVLAKGKLRRRRRSGRARP